MACATLKRSLDWESLNHQRPTKRRRCLPFATGSSSPTPSKVVESTPSPFAEVSALTPKLTPGKNLFLNYTNW